MRKIGKIQWIKFSGYYASVENVGYFIKNKVVRI